MVLVRANRVGICGTDTKIVAGAIPVEYPRIVGHEMVGHVVQTPPGSAFSPGDRVLIDPGVACGTCAMCRAGRANICLVGGLMGRDSDGVFAEYSAIPENRLIPVPGTVGDLASSLLQVLGTCVHAVDSLHTGPGDVVAVIGLGVSGQLISQLVARTGATVVGVTRSEWKRDLARQLGAAATSAPEEAVVTIDDMTDGIGPRIVVEAVGLETTLSQAISLVATGGEVLVFGTITSGREGLPYYQLYHKELTLHNPRAALIQDYEKGVSLAAAGELDLEPLVTHVLGLDDAPEAFGLVHDPTALKVTMEV
jgi:2-desacetyl-2-hydroxyethyl bacteriochlorophyllide A dehydrogenase